LKRFPPEVIFRVEEVDHKIINILYNSLNEEAYGISETNKFVWDMLDGTVSVEVIINRLYAAYVDQVEKEKLVLDVIDFLNFLWERNFIFKAYRMPDKTEVKELDCYG
jgi:predicted KAP-like P-loop ATPase